MGGIWIMLILHVAWGQNYFNEPESVVYDVKNDRYLVSNCGDGKIIQVNTIEENERPDTPTPVFEPFNADLSSTLGLHIMGDTLYAASSSGVVGFDLATGVMVMTVVINESILLNDVTSDNNGFLYVSDSEAEMIFKVDPASQSYTILVPGGITYPNGLLYDSKKDRILLVTGTFNSPVYEVNPHDGTVTQIIKTKLTYLDGLAFDKNGYVYVSSWYSNAVYRFDPEFKLPPVKISKKHKGPADICYCEKDNLIAVPNFNANKLRFIKLTPYTAIK